MLKVCYHCKITKSEIEFVSDKRTKKRYKLFCKECNRKHIKKYIEKNRHLTWAKETLRKHGENSIIVDLSISKLSDIAKQSVYCPFCGIKLLWEIGNGFQGNSPTLDRINNENFINAENVMIICRSCNISKSDRTLSEFVDYCFDIFIRSLIDPMLKRNL